MALNPIFEEQIKNELKNFSFAFLLAPSTALIGFVWIWNILIGKTINKIMALSLLIAVILIGIFIGINSEAITEFLNEILEIENVS